MKRTRNLDPVLKFQVLNKYNFVCQFCGESKTSAEMEVDHLVPVSRCGSDSTANLTASCKKCNRGKSDLIIFPNSMIEGIDKLDKSWFVHKSFGDWKIKYHPEIDLVLEYDPYGYWFEAKRAFENWENHISKKDWPLPHKYSDFCDALSYFRTLCYNQNGGDA